MRVEAGWLFKGGDQGMEASSERSESANEDILIFFFQLDLATRVQVRLAVLSFSFLYTVKLMNFSLLPDKLLLFWSIGSML